MLAGEFEAGVKALFVIPFPHLTQEEKELMYYILQLSTSKVFVAHTGREARGQQTYGFYYIFLPFTVYAT